MTVYCIGQAKNLNKERLQEYGKHAGAALSKHHGELVTRTVNPLALDGTTGNDLIVILSFPSEENAIAWREDPELSTVHDLRNASGDWTLQLLRN